MAFIPTRFHALPDTRQLNTARPVRGHVHTVLGEDTAYLAAGRWLPVFSHQCLTDFAISFLLDVAAPEHHIRWTTSDFSTDALSVHVGLIIEYFAPREPGGTTPPNPPEIIARLEDTGGAVIDNGCQWRVEDGRLDTSAGDAGSIVGGNPTIVTTGFVPVVGETALGDPRPLNADPNKDTVLVVSGRDVRIFTVAAFELYQPRQ